MDHIIDVQNARTVDVIAAEIVTIRDQTRRLVLAASVEIGRRLCEAKEMLHHGDWGAWLESSVQYSQSTANTLMRIFREYGDDQLRLSSNTSKSQTFANLGYAQAVALFSLPQEEREAFIETHDMVAPVRELKAQIETYKAALEQSKEHANAAEHDAGALRAELEDARRRHEDEIAALRAELEKAGDTGKAKELQEKLDKAIAARDKAREKARNAEAAMELEREQSKKALEGAKADAKTNADALAQLTETYKAEMAKEIEARVSEARAAMESELASARAATAKADPDVAAAKVLFESTVENVNRLRGLALRAEGEKRERLVQLLRALAGKITEGLG